MEAMHPAQTRSRSRAPERTLLRACLPSAWAGAMSRVDDGSLAASSNTRTGRPEDRPVAVRLKRVGCSTLGALPAAPAVAAAGADRGTGAGDRGVRLRDSVDHAGRAGR